MCDATSCRYEIQQYVHFMFEAHAASSLDYRECMGPSGMFGTVVKLSFWSTVQQQLQLRFFAHENGVRSIIVAVSEFCK